MYYFVLVMKKILLFGVLFFVFCLSANAVSFSDVPEKHPYYAAIESLKNLGIINGHPDGTFKPESGVIRAEALKMIMQSAGVEVAEMINESGFADVPSGEWYAVYTAKGKSLGIVKGQGATGLFTPEARVNKSEFLKMLLESFGKDLSKHQNLPEGVSDDTFTGQWYLPYFSYAKSLGIIFPTIDNRLEPDKFLSRGECADIIYKLLLVEKGGDAQKMLNLTEVNLVDVLNSLKNKDISGALDHANSAVFYSQKALDVEPDQGIVKAANKIALGFQALCLAYKAGLDADNDAVIDYANQAKELAGLAYQDYSGTQNLGKKIKEQADVLISQVAQ